MKKNKSFSFFGKIIFVLTILFLIIILLNSLFREFHPDELEHIHASWYINRGFVPFRDFFEHHNPLLWYLGSIFIYIFNESIYSLFALRMLVFCFIFLTILFQFKIAKIILNNNYYSILAAFIPYLFNSYNLYSNEFRPDTPMILFQLISTYFLFKYITDYEFKNLNISVFCLFVSFFFLQKSIFFIFGFGIALLYLIYLKKLSVYRLLMSSLFFIIPFLFCLIYLYMTSSLEDYWITNWELNMKMQGSHDIKESLITLDLIIFSFSILLVLLNLKIKDTKRTILLIIISSLFLSLLLVKFPLPHYFHSLFVFLSFLVANSLLTLKINTHRFVLIFLFIFSISVFYQLSYFKFNKNQLKTLNFALLNTNTNDVIIDGWCTFNIFRIDAHYFWFSLHKGMSLETYQSLYPNRRPYNLKKEIKLKKPKVITHSFVDVKDDYIIQNYHPISEEYPWMLFRKNK